MSTSNPAPLPIPKGFLNVSAPKLVLGGYLSYVLIGWIALAMPASSNRPISLLDHLFTAMSALSTTGLVTVDVGKDYTFLGQLVITLLIQAGGIGYMTFGSFVMLVTAKRLSELRGKISKATFALPDKFDVNGFIIQVIAFTFICETIGAAALYTVFKAKGMESPVWSSIFHSISAFCTAGFGLYSDSFASYRDDFWINLILSALSLIGGIGFIVLVDLWKTFRGQNKNLTFTSKVILSITFWFLVLGTLLFFWIEPSIQNLSPDSRLQAAFFQVMSASTTVGFNTIPLDSLAAPVVLLLVVLMAFGASPSGTGGGLKSTTFSALIGLVKSTLKGRSSIRFLKREIPGSRLQAATASFAYYLAILVVSMFVFFLTEKQDPMKLLFEATSAMGTVGMSMGITGNLTDLGKINLVLLMLIGRVGFLTFRMAISTHDETPEELVDNELVV